MAGTQTTTRLLTSGDVARRLGVSRDTVRHLVRRGELRPLRYGDGWLRFPVADVEALIRRAEGGG